MTANRGHGSPSQRGGPYRLINIVFGSDTIHLPDLVARYRRNGVCRGTSPFRTRTLHRRREQAR